MERKFLILDSRDTPLAHGYLQGRLDAPTCRLQVEEDVSQVLDHEYIKLVDMSGPGETTEGRVCGARGDLVEVEVLRTVGEDLRRTLRIPVWFESFVYPVSGGWKGRARVEGHDLSCGGVSFFCDRPLEIGETVEIVIPVTTQPLILKAKVLRVRPSPQNRPLYAAAFLKMVREEETMVCEAVFGIQLQYGKTKNM